MPQLSQSRNRENKRACLRRSPLTDSFFVAFPLANASPQQNVADALNDAWTKTQAVVIDCQLDLSYTILRYSTK
jgi:hypothetical protein